MADKGERFLNDEGVLVSPAAREKFAAFEHLYLTVRGKENRLPGIEEIRRLPFPLQGNSDYENWALRRKNMLRFLHYLKDKKPLNVLEAGCGNGYFSNLMAQDGHVVTGVDVALPELKQAIRAFPDKVRWYCLDLMTDLVPTAPFDIIVFNASFHYFSGPVQLLNKCLELLKPGGEIHILDSPFYTEQTCEAARNRSEAYFSSMEVPELINYYQHNTFEIFRDFNVSFLYNPGGVLQKMLRIKDSPFYWIRVSLK